MSRSGRTRPGDACGPTRGNASPNNALLGAGRVLPSRPTTLRFGSPGENPGWRYDRRIIDRFELAINRTRRVFTAFATAAAIGGLVGSPAALADPEPPPPPPVPAPAPVHVREVPEVQCGDTGLPWMPCEEVLVPSPPLADTPGTPDRP